MNKRAFLNIIFIALSLAVCILIANEYLKRIEVRAINSYLSLLGRESSDFSATQPVCEGFIKHSCIISRVNLGEISLENISLALQNITNKSVALEVKIADISHKSAKLFLPKHFTYRLNLAIHDSKLGYVALNRAIYVAFQGFEARLDLELMLREARFRDKSVFWLLKDWFSGANAFEYSLESLAVRVNADDISDSYKRYFEAESSALDFQSEQFLAQSDSPLQNFIAKHATTAHFSGLAESFTKLLKGEITHIDFNITRKNRDLAYFYLFNGNVATKKMLDKILESINETYAIDLATR